MAGIIVQLFWIPALACFAISGVTFVGGWIAAWQDH
jgi:hypothetical protein